MPISATNPVPNSILLPTNGAIGISLGPNLNGAGPSPTFYVVDFQGKYNYYNGTTWVNTNYTAGAVNPGGGGNYIYSIVGNSGQVFRYNGTGNATSLTTISSWNSGGPWDISVDCEGDFYILKNTQPGTMTEYDPAGTLINTYNLSGNPNVSRGGGFAIINNRAYFNDDSGFYGGNISSGIVAFSKIGVLPNDCEDFASCPIGGIPQNMHDTVSVCPGGAGTVLTTTGTGPYTWSVSSGPAVISGSGISVNVIAASSSVVLSRTATTCGPYTDTFTLNVPAAGFSASNTRRCIGDTIRFTDISSTQFIGTNWNFGDGNASGSYSPTHTYSAAGMYTITLSLDDNAGCTDVIAKNAYITISKPLAGFSAASAACLFDTIQFTDTSSGRFSPVSGWQWAMGDGYTTFLRSPAHNYHTTGNFPVTLIVSDAAGCRDTAAHTITIHTLPVIIAIGDTTICLGDTTLLSAQGGVAYIWSPAAAVSCSVCDTTYVAPVVPTDYVVSGTNTFGCRNKDTVSIKLRYKTPTYASGDTTICAGRSITLSDSGAQTYQWYPAAQLTGSNTAHPVATPTGTTTYMVVARTGNCTPDTNYVSVIVNPLPKVTATGSATVLAGAQVHLQAYGANITSFLWDHADLLTCSDCTDPIATMQQTTDFVVTATNQYGCTDSASVLVDVLCDKSQVFIPNTFTPNGDGQNDVFYPRGVGIKTVLSFRIYDRWGELVFERRNIDLNDEQSGWDGTYKGAKLSTDNFVYVLNAICYEGQHMDWKGSVTMIR